MKDKIPFSIRTLEVLNYVLNPKKEDLPPSSQIQYNLKIESSTKVNSEKKLLIVITVVTIVDKDGQNVIASISTSTSFEVDNFTEVAVIQSDSTYNVDPEIDLKLALTAINTIRGIAFVYFKGTYLSNLLIPAVGDENLQRSDS